MKLMRFKYLSHPLLWVCLAALLMRLVLLSFIEFPGIADPNHYYNLGVRILHGHGFTMDYLWHFWFDTETLVHPFDYWQPLTGILVAGGMGVLGESLVAALLPFVLIGSLLPVVSYVSARQLGCTEAGAIFAAVGAAFLPEFVMNSLRTDTLIVNALLVGFMIISLNQGLKSGRWFYYVLCGVFAGLANLTRGDNSLLLLVLAGSVVIYMIFGRGTFIRLKKLYWLPLTVLVALFIMSPWIARNYQEFGSFNNFPPLNQSIFFTEVRDHYAYNREFSLDTLLAVRTPTDLLLKRGFEVLAAIRMMIQTLDTVLPIFLIGGLVMMMSRFRDSREGFLRLTPVFIIIGGFFVSYTLISPLGNQGGSFKKVYLSLLPLLLPLAGYALETVVANVRFRWGIIWLTALIMFQSSVMFVVDDRRSTANYMKFLDEVDTALAQLPDITGDGEVRLMTQDPFALKYIGYQSVQIPMEDRDTILEVADRYEIDYILFPAARPALDVLEDGTETDARFIPAAKVNRNSTLYAMQSDIDETDDDPAAP